MFCPFFSELGLMTSVAFMTVLCVLSLMMTMALLSSSVKTNLAVILSVSLFPSMFINSIFFFSGFLLFSGLNLISLVAFSYPVTTTLSFNLSLALFLFLTSLFFLFNKSDPLAALLPANSPWYLVPFLGLVELVSVMVRPITLCFRLLANMSAGHILLSLITKLPFSAWLLGTLFGLLELMVAIVQSFVFFMLSSVYLEEGMTHWPSSFSEFYFEEVKESSEFTDLSLLGQPFLF